MPQRTVNKDLSKLGHSDETQDSGVTVAAPTSNAQRPVRVVNIPLGQIIPDRFQARVILPPELKEAFFSGEADCYAIAHSLLIAADGDAGLRYQVDELLLLGDSIQRHGQIEPATGAWVQTTFGTRFLLEAGERRFWSLVLTAVQNGVSDELKLQAVETKETNRLRQVAENLQREDLSAVDLAKAVASIILLTLNIHPADDMDETEYCRQVLKIDRLPSNTWPQIEQIVGLERSYLYRLTKILTLDDEVLYRASLYRLEERRLREIVAAPKNRQLLLVEAAIQDKLSGDDLTEVAQASSLEQQDELQPQPRNKPASGPHLRVAAKVKSWLNFVNRPDFDHNYDRVARELSSLIRDPNDLSIAAENLETLAASLRKIQTQRR